MGWGNIFSPAYSFFRDGYDRASSSLLCVESGAQERGGKYESMKKRKRWGESSCFENDRASRLIV